MTGSGTHDNEKLAGRSDSGGSSSATHHPVDDPHHQQQYNMDPSRQERQPPLGYPGPEASVTQGPYEHQTSYQSRHAAASPPPWQDPGAYPPPPHHQPGYQPQAGATYSQQMHPPPQHQQPQYPHQQQYQPQYGSPYNNPAPTRPPPVNQYGQQQQPGAPPPPVFVPPMRASSPRPFTPGVLRPDLASPPGPWTSDIFGFLHDCNGCIVTVLAPCITFGQIAEIMDTGYNSCTTAAVFYGLSFLVGMPCLYSYSYRTKMRRHFNLRPDPVEDLCVHFWCELCALSQEYRELAYRGIDPALGYAMQRDIIAQAMDNPITPSMGAPAAMNMMK